jgi:hypothetical protein
MKVFLRGLAAGLVVLLSVACTSSESRSTDAPAVPPPASTAQLLAAVEAAQNVQRLPDRLVAALNQDDTGGAKQIQACEPVDRPTIKSYFGECNYGSKSGARLMVVYGDSHAYMWSQALESIAQEFNWQLRIYSLPDCPVPDLPYQSGETKTPFLECDDYRTRAIAAINERRPDLIVAASNIGHILADGRWATPTQWRDGLSSTFRELSPSGATIAFIGTIPNWPDNNARCLAAHLSDVQDCSAPRADATPALLGVEESTVKSAGALYIPTLPWVCAERCEPVIADTLVYRNEFHLTGAFVNVVTPALREAMQPVLGR